MPEQKKLKPQKKPRNNTMKRTDIVMLIGAKLCNPNGDPDGDNAPRTDPDSNRGIITKASLARKVRNYIQAKYGQEPGYDIYVKENTVLGQTRVDTLEEKKIKITKKEAENLEGQRALLEKFFDLRTFGGVLTGSETVNCGQVRGPVQMTMFESIDPVSILDVCITRCAAETPKEAEKSKDGKSKTMGGFKAVSYGLYKGIVSINPVFAEATGFSEQDKERLLEALQNLFSVDSSSARPSGSLTIEKLWVFEHESPFGNEQSAKLARLIDVKAKDPEPKSFEDYEIAVGHPKDGISLVEKV
jgi:CRISPR-associated protein Csd2